MLCPEGAGDFTSAAQPDEAVFGLKDQRGHARLGQVADGPQCLLPRVARPVCGTRTDGTTSIEGGEKGHYWGGEKGRHCIALP